MAVVGGEAEYTPHSIQRMAGGVRSSGTADGVQASQNVLACDEGSGPVAEDGILTVLPFRLPNRAKSLPDLRLVWDLAEPVGSYIARDLMTLSLLRQLFGHIYLGKSAKRLDD